RNDIYYGTAASSYRTLPKVNLSVSEAPIGGTKVSVGGSLDAIGLVRIPDVDNPEIRDEMFRTDGRVTMRAPISFGDALSLTTTVTARRTDWNASRDPETGARIEAPIFRQLFEAQVQARGPVFSRIYNMGDNARLERVKHVITPTVTVKRTS